MNRKTALGAALLLSLTFAVPARAANEPGIRERISEKLAYESNDAVNALVNHLIAQHGKDAIEAIVFYGSRQWGEGIVEDPGVFDFFVITNDPKKFHRNQKRPRTHAVLTRVLAPTIYAGEAPSDDPEKPLEYKACVLTGEQFARETSKRAKDVYVVGRFSKVVTPVYWKNEAAKKKVLKGVHGAMASLIPHTLTRLGSNFTLDEFIETQLGLSYAEVRVDEPTKVKELFEANEAFYRDVYGELLAAYAVANPDVVTNLGHDNFKLGKEAKSQEALLRTRRFLKRSRWRSALRLLKQALTCKGWEDIVRRKYEKYAKVKMARFRLGRNPLNWLRIGAKFWKLRKKLSRAGR